MSQYIFNETKDNISRMERDVVSLESKRLNAQLRELISLQKQSEEDTEIHDSQISLI